MRGLTPPELAMLLELDSENPPRQIRPDEISTGAALHEQGRIKLVHGFAVSGYALTPQGAEALQLWPAVAAAFTGAS